MGSNLTPVSAVHNLTKKEADEVEARAVKLYQTLEKTSVIFAMELRRLKEGSAHLVRGYGDFGTYAERAFEGMSKSNAEQLSRMGAVMLRLEDAGKINPSMSFGDLPGATGVRALAKILKDYGEEVMLAVYDRALSYDRKITDETVLAATRELIQPTEPYELGTGAEEEPEPTEEDEDFAELPEEVEAVLEAMSDITHEIRSALLDNMPDTAMSRYKELQGKVKELGKLIP